MVRGDGAAGKGRRGGRAQGPELREKVAALLLRCYEDRLP
jgi:hypothetical protein